MAKKDSFYFPHDYNSSNDVKCLFLRQQLGMEGYGIFWYIVESLANAGGVLPLKITPVLSMQMQVPEVKVMAVINNFDLFVIIEDNFFSNRLNDHLEIRKTLSLKGKEGADLRWKDREAIGEAISNPNAKERKEKEIKEKEIKVNIPSKDEFLQYCQERCLGQGFNWAEYKQGASTKYDAWRENGWKDLKGNKIGNWKSKVINNLEYFKTKINGSEKLGTSDARLQALAALK